MKLPQLGRAGESYKKFWLSTADMVWFSCEDCGDSIKKPKLQAHINNCSASHLTCIDCNVTFSQRDAKGHNSCVTEHQKYAEGATKPGGLKANGITIQGVKNELQPQNESTKNPSEIAGMEFLSTSRPWKCRLCNVSCTSQETLFGHASGLKHIRKAKAAKTNSEEGGKSLTENFQPISLLQENGIKLKDDSAEMVSKQMKETENTRPPHLIENENESASLEPKKKKRRKSETLVEENSSEKQTLDPVSPEKKKIKKSKDKSKKQSNKSSLDKINWEREAVSLLKQLSKRDFSKFRRKLLKSLDLSEDLHPNLDSLVFNALKESSLLSITESEISFA